MYCIEVGKIVITKIDSPICRFAAVAPLNGYGPVFTVKDCNVVWLGFLSSAREYIIVGVDGVSSAVVAVGVQEHGHVSCHIVDIPKPASLVGVRITEIIVSRLDSRIDHDSAVEIVDCSWSFVASQKGDGKIFLRIKLYRNVVDAGILRWTVNRVGDAGSEAYGVVVVSCSVEVEACGINDNGIPLPETWLLDKTQQRAD